MDIGSHKKGSPEREWEIESKLFRAGRSRFALLLLERNGLGWSFAGGMFIVASLILGFLIDLRILVVAIILICLISPLFLMVLYYNYGMKGENFINVLDHKLSLNRNVVKITLRIKGKTEKEGEMDEEGNEKRISNEEERCEEEWRFYTYSSCDFGAYTVGRDYVVFPFLPPHTGFLYLPVDAFADMEEFKEVVKKIANENN